MDMCCVLSVMDYIISHLDHDQHHALEYEMGVFRNLMRALDRAKQVIQALEERCNNQQGNEDTKRDIVDITAQQVGNKR